ncbi:g9540 [Coccomyxa elongata]
MGSQGGGWGHDEGTAIFSQLSQCGNGLVTVTSHAASHVEPPPPGSLLSRTEGGVLQDWRTLRFNGVTRQSVAKVWRSADGGSDTLAQADCLGMEYLKTMASAAASVMGMVQDDAAFLQRCLNRPSLADGQDRRGQPSAVCIGVGGGSLPLFLSHHFPGMHVEAVDLDSAVLAAASQAMGFPLDKPGLEVHERDGVTFISERAAEIASGASAPVDLLFLDVFDGDDQVPLAFKEAGGEFVRSAAQALHPVHGAIVVNMHSGPRPGLGDVLRRRLTGEPSLTFDPASEEGRELLALAHLYRDALLMDLDAEGDAWVVGAERQFNAAINESQRADGEIRACMVYSRMHGVWLAVLAIQGVFLMASAQSTSQPRAGAVYIIEAANATFVNANTLVLAGASGSTAFKVDYPYSDAGVLDTGALLQNPVYSPNGVWLGSPMGTIFGTAVNGNASAVILLINALPVFDPAAGTLTFNITIVFNPASIKFPGGVARLTYEKAVNPSAYAKPLVVTAQVSNGAVMTSVALFLDVDQSTIVPASAPQSTGIVNNNNNNGGITNNNNNGGGTITNNNENYGGYNNNNNNGGSSIINNNGGVPSSTSGGSGIVNNNNNGGGFTTNNNNGGGSTITNNNGVTASSVTPSSNSITNNNNNSGGSTNNNNNGASGTILPPAPPGQTPSPGTYNVITTTTDCNGNVDVQYSYVPGLRGISRNNNNNCG